MTYKPHEKSRAILDKAWALVEGVPYRVTLRWLFYELLGDVYKDKKDYKRFIALLSRARHNFWQGWAPDTLADDRRIVVDRGDGFLTVEDWADYRKKKGKVSLARWEGQEYYCEIWFEANAMKGQFAYYTKNVVLRPFGGDPSIPYKWKAAKHLEYAHKEFGLPIVVLYFGDLDPKGMTILKVAERDIREWCDVPFEVIRCGLNPGDEIRYNLKENFEKPGCYQWEALGDEQARQLIKTWVEKYVDYEAMARIEREEARATDTYREYMADFSFDDEEPKP